MGSPPAFSSSAAFSSCPGSTGVSISFTSPTTSATTTGAGDGGGGEGGGLQILSTEYGAGVQVSVDTKVSKWLLSWAPHTACTWQSVRPQ